MNEKKLPSWQEFQNDLIVRAMQEENFRTELLADHKAVVEKEMGKLTEGFKFPAGLEVKVIEQPANALYLVLPIQPEKKFSGELSDDALAKVAGGTATAAKNVSGVCPYGFYPKYCGYGYFPEQCERCKRLGRDAYSSERYHHLYP